MAYFKNVKSFEDLKEQFKALARVVGHEVTTVLFPNEY